MKKQGFTLVELLVVVAIIALLLGILLPALSRAREIANRSVSAANLKGINTSMAVYAVSNGDKYPAFARTGAGNAQGFVAALYNTTNPAATNTNDNVTAALFILVKDGSVAPKSWVNPSSGDTRDPIDNGMQDTHDFKGPENLSYAPINMYNAQLSSRWGSNAPGDFVIMGDDNNNTGKNVGNTDWTNVAHRQAWNSLNHNREGQNLAVGGSAVNFFQNPAEGANGDNVYAWNSNTTLGSHTPNISNIKSNTQTYPTNANADTVLLDLTDL